MTAIQRTRAAMLVVLSFSLCGQAIAAEQGPQKKPRILILATGGTIAVSIARGAIDGLRVEGSFRSHQVPISSPRTNPSHLAALERWLAGEPEPFEIGEPDLDEGPHRLLDPVRDLEVLRPREAVSDQRALEGHDGASGVERLRDLPGVTHAGITVQ